MVVGSNIVSNVPLVVLIAQRLQSLAPDVLQPALLAAWTTTVGGNLSLFGSVSNLIVVERAKRHPRGVTVTFSQFVKFGFWSTIITTSVGQILLSVLWLPLES